MKIRLHKKGIVLAVGLFAATFAVAGTALLPSEHADVFAAEEGRVLYYVDAGNLVSSPDGTGNNTDRGTQGYSNAQDTPFMQTYGLTFKAGKTGSLYNSVTDKPYGSDIVSGKYWGFSTANSGVTYYWDSWRYGRTGSENIEQTGFQSYRQTNEGNPYEGVLAYTFEVDDATTELDITFGVRIAPGWGSKPATYSVNGGALQEYEANDSQDLEYTIENVTGVQDDDGRSYITLEFGQNNVNAYVSWILITTDEYELVSTQFVNYTFSQSVKKGDTHIMAYHPADGEDVQVEIPQTALTAIAEADVLGTVTFTVTIGGYDYEVSTVVLPEKTKYFVDVGTSLTSDENILPDIAYSADGTEGYGYTGTKGTEAYPGSYEYSIVYGANNAPFEYTFEVEAGAYAVVVGTYGHWSMGRTMEVSLNGVESGELTAVADTATSGKYFTTVNEAGVIELDVAFGNDNYIVSYVLVYGVNSINYDACGGTAAEPIYFDQGESASFIERSTQYTGHVFMGWYTQPADGEKVEAGTIFSDSVTVYAHWTVGQERVFLTLMEGKIEGLPEYVDLAFGGIVSGLPASDEEKEGYSFGWFTKAVGGNRIENGDTWTETVTELFGRYAPNEYTVMLNAGDGTVDESTCTATYDAPLYLPDPAAPDGKYFIGWYTAQENGELVADGALWERAEENVTLYAVYEDAEVVSVTLNADGGVPADGELPVTFSVTQGSAVTGLMPLIKTGYIFIGWFTAQEGGREYRNGTIWSEDTSVTELFARFTESNYEINYVVNGGSSVPQGTYTYGTGLAELPVSVKQGSVFAGWYLNADFSGDAVVAISAEQYGDVTLYAKWDVAIYDVIFDSCGGSNVAPVSVAFGSVAEQPVSPTRNGYKFVGWTTEDGAMYDFASAVTGLLKLYAAWMPAVYRVTYQVNGGKEVGSAVYTYGTGLAQLPASLRDGYIFSGWYLNEDLTGEKVSAISSEQYGDLTLYAKWEPIVYSVVFHEMGGSEVASSAVGAGETVAKPADPTREGFVFTGWYKDEACTQEYDFGSVVASNITLYAGWATEEPAGGCASTIATVPFAVVGGVVLLAVILLIVRKKQSNN